MRPIIACWFYLIALLVATDVFAYKTVNHLAISTEAEALSENYKKFLKLFSQDTNLAFGLTELGGIFEDDDRRYLRHFYDPINEVGLSRILGNFESAVSWGLESDANIYSWAKARNYMFQALTGESPEIQDINYNHLYRALGQVIHLIGDMAQPSHTRDDAHVSHSENTFGAEIFNPAHLEDWAQSHLLEVAVFLAEHMGHLSDS